MKWIAVCLLMASVNICFEARPALAACTSFPNSLTNGTTADGSQVIANMTYLSGCLAPLSTPTFSGDVTVNGGLLEYGNGIAVFSTNAYGAGISMQNQTTSHTWHLRYDGGSLLGHPDYFTIYDGTVGSRLVIDTAGNVGIGTTAPGATLDVEAPASGLLVKSTTGTSRAFAVVQNTFSAFLAGVASSAGGGSLFTGDTAYAAVVGNQYNYPLEFATNNTVRATLDASGSLGIGTTTPSYTLHVNGSVAGTSAYNNLSDARLKKNFEPIKSALSIIEHLRGVRFKWRSPKERSVGKAFNLPTDSPQIGFVAQDLKKVLPEAVTVASGSEGIMSVQESKVVPVLVEALKQLKAANENQLAEIRQLRARNEAQIGLMRAQLRTLEQRVGIKTAQN
jgi:hypothetical protein